VADRVGGGGVRGRIGWAGRPVHVRHARRGAQDVALSMV
jgi:hypothetical protein